MCLLGMYLSDCWGNDISVCWACIYLTVGVVIYVCCVVISLSVGQVYI